MSSSRSNLDRDTLSTETRKRKRDSAPFSLKELLRPAITIKVSLPPVALRCFGADFPPAPIRTGPWLREAFDSKTTHAIVTGASCTV